MRSKKQRHSRHGPTKYFWPGTVKGTDSCKLQGDPSFILRLLYGSLESQRSPVLCGKVCLPSSQRDFVGNTTTYIYIVFPSELPLPVGACRFVGRQFPRSGKVYYLIACFVISFSSIVLSSWYRTSTMDSFHHRDQIGWDWHSNSPPAYFSPSRSQSDLWRSSPLKPRPSQPPSPLLSTPCLNPVKNIAPLEDKTTLGEEQREVVKEFKSPYDQARECVDHFKNWHSGAKIKPGSLEVFESNLSIKMSMKEWIKLSKDLNIFETDEKYKSSYASLKRYC